MSDFRRNLHKLYPDHNNPKNDYEQTHSNQVQYLMRRKTNKNQQPRQFQQNMNRSYDGYKGSNATQPIYTYSRPNLWYNDERPAMDIIYDEIDRFASEMDADTMLHSKNIKGETVEILLLDQSGG